MIQNDKELDLDWFQVGLFQLNLKIVGNCVTKVKVDFLKRGNMLKAWNATFLVMTPKTTTTKELKEYRPIILFNAIYNIIT